MENQSLSTQALGIILTGRKRFLLERIRSGRHAGHAVDRSDTRTPPLVEWDENHLRKTLAGPLVHALSGQPGGVLAETYLRRKRREMLAQLGQSTHPGGAEPFEIARLEDGGGVYSRLEPLQGVTWQLWAGQSAHIRRAWFGLAVLDGCYVRRRAGLSPNVELEWSRPDGYTTRDVGLLAGATVKSEGQRVRDRLEALGVLYRLTYRGQPRFLFAGWPFPEALSPEWHPGYDDMVREIGRICRDYGVGWLRSIRDEARAEMGRIRRMKPPRSLPEADREVQRLLFEFPNQLRRRYLGMDSEGAASKGTGGTRLPA